MKPCKRCEQPTSGKSGDEDPYCPQCEYEIKRDGLMTLREAMARGLTKVRMYNWNPQAHLVLDRNEDGMYGPWAKLIDPPGQFALNSKPDNVLVIGLPQTPDWVVFQDESEEDK